MEKKDTISELIHRDLHRLYGKVLWKRVILSQYCYALLLEECSDERYIHWKLGGSEWVLDEYCLSLYRLDCIMKEEA